VRLYSRPGNNFSRRSPLIVEARGETLARVGLAQFVVFLLMVGWATAKKKGAAEIETGKPTAEP
jgi:hypothetical protein